MIERKKYRKQQYTLEKFSHVFVMEISEYLLTSEKKCMEDHGNIIKHFKSPFCFSQKDTKNEYQRDG